MAASGSAPTRALARSTTSPWPITTRPSPTPCERLPTRSRRNARSHQAGGRTPRAPLTSERGRLFDRPAALHRAVCPPYLERAYGRERRPVSSAGPWRTSTAQSLSMDVAARARPRRRLRRKRARPLFQPLGRCRWPTTQSTPAGPATAPSAASASRPSCLPQSHARSARGRGAWPSRGQEKPAADAKKNNAPAQAACSSLLGAVVVVGGSDLVPLLASGRLALSSRPTTPMWAPTSRVVTPLVAGAVIRRAGRRHPAGAHRGDILVGDRPRRRQGRRRAYAGRPVSASAIRQRSAASFATNDQLSPPRSRRATPILRKASAQLARRLAVRSSPRPRSIYDRRQALASHRRGVGRGAYHRQERLPDRGRQPQRHQGGGRAGRRQQDKAAKSQYEAAGRAHPGRRAINANPDVLAAKAALDAAQTRPRPHDPARARSTA